MNPILRKIFGDPNKKIISRLWKDVEAINSLEQDMSSLSDEGLKAKTAEFKQKIADGLSPDDLTHEAFAVVRESAKRNLGQRHFDVQLMGGLILHSGTIAEMRTGEGKTLTSTAPIYLNALTGKGVHVVTVNDYLAKRDAVWMGQVYYSLGLSVGCIAHETGFLYDPSFKHQTEAQETEHDKDRDQTASFHVHHDYLRPCSRKEAYAADITYGTNNEFGFDYLRDNMAWSSEQTVQRELNFAIVDEVDSILIDEARTPLIISAPAEESADLYYKFAQLVARLRENEDYNVDEKMRSAALTESGMKKMEELLGVENMYVSGGSRTVHHIEQALRARTLFQNDRDYVIQDGEVLIVDQFTGRIMEGRRYSDGLHQAIEAKENVEIKRESQTLATITFQNYFRMYGKLAGMTGTAATEEEEFQKIYGLDVVILPTNKPSSRNDLHDRIYKNEIGKYTAVVAEVKKRHESGQPVLIGTVSIDKNELVSELLKREGIPHQVLNAKQHESEGETIAQAGREGSVTVATNMAGRGVDIVLGGVPYDQEKAERVKNLGGLFVLGTERHEARRIDNQLRGRAGRQGDPGETVFCVSMEDDIMRIFGSDRVKGIMNKLGIPDDMPIEMKIVGNALEKAQHRVEGHHFDMRKHLLEYDDVLNKQRDAIYRRRREILLASENSDVQALKEHVLKFIEEETEEVVLFHTGEKVEIPGAVKAEPDQNAKEILETFETILPLDETSRAEIRSILDQYRSKDKMSIADLRDKLINKAMEVVEREYESAEKQITDRNDLCKAEKSLLLRTSDALWIEHLDAMNYLRTAISLHGYGQRDPLVEYKKESYTMFQQLLSAMRQEVAYNFFKYIKQYLEAKRVADTGKSLLERSGVQLSGADKTMGGTNQPQTSKADKVGRNDFCPCGSGKKYKKCHGA